MRDFLRTLPGEGVFSTKPELTRDALLCILRAEYLLAGGGGGGADLPKGNLGPKSTQVYLAYT